MWCPDCNAELDVSMVHKDRFCPNCRQHWWLDEILLAAPAGPPKVVTRPPDLSLPAERRLGWLDDSDEYKGTGTERSWPWTIDQ